MTAIARRFNGLAFMHDDSPAFHAAYIALTFIAAALFNVGAFALVVLAHMVLDLFKYYGVHTLPLGRSLAATMRESIVDIALLMVALCFAVYLHHATSIVVVSGLLHVEQTVIRALGMTLPRLEVLWHNMHVFGRINTHMQRLRAGERVPWTIGEWACAGVLAICCVLIAAAPSLLASPEVVMRILTEQLVPWHM